MHGQKYIKITNAIFIFRAAQKSTVLHFRISPRCWDLRRFGVLRFERPRNSADLEKSTGLHCFCVIGKLLKLTSRQYTPEITSGSKPTVKYNKIRFFS